MSFKEWLKSKGLTEQAAADMISVSQAAVHRYCTGRVPRPAVILRIKKVTRGEVTEIDWYNPRYLSADIIERGKVNRVRE